MDSPQSPGGPQGAASGPQSPAPGPEAPTSPAAQPYGGPVPPGGWQQPPPRLVSGELASWGTRAAAYLIDGLIIVVPALIILGILGAGIVAADDGDSVAALVGGVMLTVLVVTIESFLYAPLLMIRQGERNGQTIGKQLMGIRAVRDNGQPWTFGSAAVREVLVKSLAVGIASSIIPFVPWFLNFFWPLWDDENRALHDMVVSSHVVRA
jgi:uncharacterized RDD family membrane protein YckC